MQPNWLLISAGTIRRWELVRDLIDHNVKGVHLYTLNKSSATRQIYDSLGVTSTRRLI